MPNREKATSTPVSTPALTVSPASAKEEALPTGLQEMADKHDRELEKLLSNDEYRDELPGNTHETPDVRASKESGRSV